jgi:hypothetical protein
MADQITPQRGLTFDDVWAALMELRENQKETDRRLAAAARQIEETGRQMKETDQRMKETDRQMKETDRKLGRLGNSFGELAEHLVLPNILEKFRARGYVFTKAGSDLQFKDQNGKTIAEVDIWLENGDYVLAIEVKARLREKDVGDHIRRMGVLRGYFDDHRDNRKLLGAVAGAVMMEEAKIRAEAEGFYVIEQTGDTVRIIETEGWTPKEW